MYILSLSIGLSIHNYVNFWRNHFKISKVVVEKRTSGCRSITSSIYLNLNISVIYYRIKIKLVLEKAEWQCLFIRILYSHFRSRRHDVIKHSIADIPLKLRWIEPQFGHRDQGSSWCHLKYHVILKVTLTLWVNCKVNAYIISFSFGVPFITLSILCQITSNFQLWSLKKGTSGYIGMTSSISLNWHISFI